MTDTPPARRLAAIMLADIARFSALMERDETHTFERVRAMRDDLVLPLLAEGNGRLIKLTGDGFLAEFASAAAALQCAMAIQQANWSRESQQPDGQRLCLRIGIHLGDIIIDGDDIAGDGVNIAARLEPLAPLNGICVSAAVRDQLHDGQLANVTDLGEQKLKNISRAVRAFAIHLTPATSPPAKPQGKRWRYAAAGGAGLAIAVAIAAVTGLPGLRPGTGKAIAVAPADAAPAIAVLPFADMSQAKDQEYFSDGISEELLNLLTQVPQLRVIARSSSFSFKGKPLDITVIAHQLNVGYLLQGSVRRAGDKLRITAQLIRTADSAQLWSETFERTQDDIFKIQDDIAAAVVERLKLTLFATAPKARPIDPEAYARILQAKYVARQDAPESNGRAIALFQQALALEPNATAAWNGLAGIYLNQAAYATRDSVQQTTTDALRAAKDAAEHALASDPANALAHAQLGMAALYSDTLPRAIEHFQRAHDFDQRNTEVLNTIVRLLAILGRYDDAVALGEYLVAQDPANQVAYTTLSRSCFMAGKWERLISAARAAQALSPGSVGSHFRIAIAMLMLGDAAGALKEAQTEQAEAYRLIATAVALHDLGRKADADAALASLTQKFEAEYAYNIASVHAYRGQPELAFAWLEKARARHDTGLSAIASAPFFKPLHDDPRWPVFLRKIGRAPEQVAAIKFTFKPPR